MTSLYSKVMFVTSARSAIKDKVPPDFYKAWRRYACGILFPSSRLLLTIRQRLLAGKLFFTSGSRDPVSECRREGMVGVLADDEKLRLTTSSVSPVCEFAFGSASRGHPRNLQHAAILPDKLSRNDSIRYTS